MHENKIESISVGSGTSAPNGGFGTYLETIASSHRCHPDCKKCFQSQYLLIGNSSWLWQTGESNDVKTRSVNRITMLPVNFVWKTTRTLACSMSGGHSRVNSRCQSFLMWETPIFVDQIISCRQN